MEQEDQENDGALRRCARTQARAPLTAAGAAAGAGSNGHLLVAAANQPGSSSSKGSRGTSTRRCMEQMQQKIAEQAQALKELRRKQRYFEKSYATHHSFTEKSESDF